MLSTQARAAASSNATSVLRRPAPLTIALVLLGCGLQLGYLALWPLSYRLTHGVDFTYQYLVRYEALWLNVVHPLVRFWDAVWPGIATSYVTNVNLLLVTFLLLFGLYLAAAVLVYGARAERGLAPLIVTLALVFQLTLFLMPGLFTTDIFSYAMYGHIAGVYQLNPYLYTPGDFPRHPLVDWIHPIWHFAPSVYGPVWVNLSAVLSASMHDWPLVDRILAYKLLINLVHLANVGLVWALLARFQPGTRVAGLLLFAWNPLLLFEFAGNGHNDAMMLTFLLLSVLLLVRGRPGWGIAALALSVWIKYTTALLVPLYLVVWLRQQPSRAAQLRVLALAGLAMGGIAVTMYLPWLDRSDVFGPIVEWAKGPMYGNHPPEVIASLVAGWSTAVAGVYPWVAETTARDVTKLITRAAFVIYFLYELRGVTSLASLVSAATRVFAVFLLVVHTWVLAWYWSWPVAMAVLLGLRHPLTQVMLGMSCTALVITYAHQYWGMEMNLGTMALYISPLLAPILWARLQRRSVRAALLPKTRLGIDLAPARTTTDRVRGPATAPE